MSMDSTKGAPGKEATFRDLLQFPCSFSFRVIGGDIDGMEEKIIGCLKEQFDRSPLAPVTRTLSRKGTYASYAVTCAAGLLLCALIQTLRPLLYGGANLFLVLGVSLVQTLYSMIFSIPAYLSVRRISRITRF